MMKAKCAICFGLCVGMLFDSDGMLKPAAQEGRSGILVNVVLVQLSIAVTDRNGNYVTGLRPEDFAVTEDKIPETIASFEGGGGEKSGSMSSRTIQPDRQPVTTTNDEAQQHEQSSIDGQSPLQVPRFAGANVFILFDTSDYMYRGFTYAQDAIAGFVGSLQDADKIAFYSYSRNLSRATALTSDRSVVLRGVHSTVAGDEAALYNCLLLTVKDAAPLRGRKAVVVFSNGPDDASSVPPEDVEELAQSTGTIIYIISTRAAEDDPMSGALFERMSKSTGGKAYFAKNWQGERLAFSSVRDDLANLYTITYYPKPNNNHGWRTIGVKLVGKNLAKYRVRTRDGYRLSQQAAVASASAPIQDPGH